MMAVYVPSGQMQVAQRVLGIFGDPTSVIIFAEGRIYS